MMVEAAESQQLPEATTSFTVMAYYDGFQVIIIRRNGEQSIISQVPGIVALVQKLVEAGFELITEAPHQALPTTETKIAGKEKPVPICQIYNVPMVWKQGIIVPI